MNRLFVSYVSQRQAGSCIYGHATLANAPRKTLSTLKEETTGKKLTEDLTISHNHTFIS